MENKNKDSPKKVIFCHFCEREITKFTYIHCEACKSIEICLLCFANGKQNQKHKREHPYRIIDKLGFSIFDENWTALEELLFLEALETFGFGNWKDISNHVGNKNSEEAEKHFYFCYLPFLKVKSEERFEKKNLKKENLGNFKCLVDRKNEKLEGEILNAEIYAKEKNFDSSNNSIYGEILGYMPLREEFDVEYDNEAELLLAEMEFTEEDTEDEKSCKYSILEIYNKRLKEREKRKKFVIERELLNLKKYVEEEKKMSKVEREVRNLVKPYARFISKEEYEELVVCILDQLEYKDLMEKMNSLKMTGHDTLEDIEKLIFDKNKNDKIPDISLFLERNKFSKRKSQKYTNEIQLHNLCQNHQKQSLIDHEPDFCEKELKLCEDLNLKYDDYMVIKEYLVRECIHKGYIDRETIFVNYRGDKNVIHSIIDFHVKHDILIDKN